MPPENLPLPKMQAWLFGRLTVHIGGAPISKLRSRSGEWLLALLILRHGETVQREWLAQTLWSESPPPAARDNLRHSLCDLCRVMGSEAIRLQAPTLTTLRLDLAGAEVDVLKFDTMIESEHIAYIESAIELYKSPLLKDCHVPWIETERTARQAKYLAALKRLAANARVRSNSILEQDYLRRILAIEPSREDTVIRLMDVLAIMDDHDAALQLFRKLRVDLARELGSAPKNETLAKYHEIQAAVKAKKRNLRVRESTPASLASAVGSVPEPLVRLIGRAEAIWEILACLERSRLVTLTGGGGIGKTQMALNAAREARSDYPDGVWFIDLSTAHGIEQIVSEIAQIFGCEEKIACRIENLIRFLELKRLLLVLDNCEHLIPDITRFARRLIQGCAHIRLLATSRQPLRLTGEQIWAVPFLDLPPLPPSVLWREGAEDEIVCLLQRYSAIELFEERAMQASNQFVLNAENALTVTRICHRLEGMPLAIELAASWLQQQTPDKILAGLEDCFSFLTNGDPSGPARQQTLRATLDWSYKALTQTQQRLWYELSVFTGEWSIEAAESVCAPFVEDNAMESCLNELADHSMVIVNAGSFEKRYRLLETLREYGAEKLNALPDQARNARNRHLYYYTRQATMEEPNLAGKDQAACMKRLKQDRDNYRQALAWAEERRDGAAGLSMASALWRFWDIQGDYAEGYRWLDTMIRLARDVTPQLRMKAVGAAGNLAYRRADYANARRCFKSHLEMARRLERPQGVASSLGNLGNIASSEGKLEEARDYYLQCLSVFEELDDRRGIALTLSNLAIVACRSGDYAAACKYHEKSISMLRDGTDALNLAMALANLAETRVLIEEYDLAGPALTESFRLSYAHEHWRTVIQCLLIYLSLAVRKSLWHHAAILIGILDTLHKRTELALPAATQKQYEFDLSAAQEQLAPREFQAARLQGRSMTDEETRDYILAIGDHIYVVVNSQVLSEVGRCVSSDPGRLPIILPN